MKENRGLLISAVCILIGILLMCDKVQAAEVMDGNENPIIVVLDPGHGGENLGAQYNGYTEKEMTLVVAQAMKEELEKYEGIEVYLTRYDDADMTLEERAEYAKSVNADFMFCLHFNMSANHNLFGSEVWVSAFGERYAQGYAFATVEMELLEELGLYSRGIKTRLNDEGEDYYGIIRHSTARDFTTVLIEHCHLDQQNDENYYTSEEKLRQFGILDATAVARYYGLRSEILGVDYSGYTVPEIPEPSAPVKPDLTEPDICVIEVQEVNQNNGEITLSVLAEDYDSHILYYSYSYDGGETFGDVQIWEPQMEDVLTFTMKIPSGTIPELVVNVYNAYDRITESNHISLPSIAYKETEESVEAGSIRVENPSGEENGVTEEIPASKKEGIPSEPAAQAERDREYKDIVNEAEDKADITFGYFLMVCFICMSILVVLLLIALTLVKGRLSGYKRRSTKKRRRRK